MSKILAQDKASEIKRRHYTTKTSLRKLAKEFGVSHQTIFLVVRGATWIRL